MAPLLKVKKLSDKVILPSRGSALAIGSDFTAGYDLSRGKALATTDLSISIPEGTYARIGDIEVGPSAEALHRRGRWGDRCQLSGPVGIALFNLSEADFVVRPGDRVVQMIVHVIATPEVTEVNDLDATLHGDQGKRHEIGRKRAPS
ncbi:hypothetical protein ZWY2020_025179 [Hordeum vulgare]|nr:hypothetical protein ZWY2020_025179 [Hordeum vulgare]